MNGGSLHPRRVSLLILLGLGTQVLMNVVFANYLHWTYPWDTFLFNSADRFNDFYHQARSYSADVIQPTNLCLPYFHLNVLGFHYVVRTLGVVPAFLSCLSLFVAVHWAWLWACLKRAGSNRLLCCVIIAFLNYPTLFAIDRGNTEVLVYALNVLIFLTFTKRWYGLSALLIGVGVNHKPFPIVFLLLLVRKRLWSRITLALGAAGLIFWISGMKAVALRSQDYYYMYNNNMIINFDIGPWSSYYGHSLFIPFKLARALIVCKKSYYINRSNFYGFYGVLSALTLAGSGVLCWRRRVRLLDLLVLITMLESSLPWTAGDYTLLHLFLPLGVLLHRRRVARLDRVITCLLAVLLIPKHYFWFALTPLGQVVRMTNSGELNSIGVAWFGISTSGLISPIICLILLLCCLARPLIRGRGPSRALVGGERAPGARPRGRRPLVLPSGTAESSGRIRLR